MIGFLISDNEWTTYSMNENVNNYFIPGSFYSLSATFNDLCLLIGI